MANFWTPVLEARSTFKDPDFELVRALTGGVTNPSGQVVSSTTALGVTAYFACIRNKSDDIAETPIRMIEEVKPGIFRAVNEHPSLTLVADDPNPMMDPMDFWSTMVGHMNGWKGAFAEIVFNSFGQPVEMWPIDPNTVHVMWDIPHKTLVYEVTENGQFFRFRPKEIFHLSGFGFDGFTSFIMSQVAQTAIGKALATQDFSAAFFGNGATLNAVLEAPPTLTETGLKLLRSSFRERHQGARKAYDTPILPDGVTYREITNNPKNSQLIEAMHGGTEDMARLFRMPPHKIQHDLHSTFTNIAEQNRRYVEDTLSADVRRIVQQAKKKLLPAPGDKRKRFKYDFSELLEGDPVSQADVEMKWFQMGRLTINEQLEKSNRPPIGPEGDIRFVPANLMALSAVRTEPAEVVTEPEPDEATANGDESLIEQPTESESNRAILQQVAEGIRDAQPALVADAVKHPTNGALSAIIGLFRRDFRRFQRITETKCMTAIEKERLIPWAQEHYIAEEKYVSEYLMEQYAVLLAVLPGKHMPVSDLAEKMAREYIAESYTRVMKGARGEKTDNLDLFAATMAIRAVRLAGADCEGLDICDPTG